MGFFKDILSGGGSLHKKITPKELRKLGPKEIQPGGFDPARDWAGFDINGKPITVSNPAGTPRDRTRLYTSPGELSRFNPNGPSTGPTMSLNRPGPNTNRLMPSTGGRTYVANPFNSQQGTIRPPASVPPMGMAPPGPGPQMPNMGFGGGGGAIGGALGQAMNNIRPNIMPYQPPPPGTGVPPIGMKPRIMPSGPNKGPIPTMGNQMMPTQPGPMDQQMATVQQLRQPRPFM